MPDMGQKQLRQMTRMLTQFKPGRPTQDLLQAVELCKGSLYRLRPEVYTILPGWTFITPGGKRSRVTWTGSLPTSGDWFRCAPIG